MQPILAADSFRLNLVDFQFQLASIISSDEAKSADDLVLRVILILKSCFVQETISKCNSNDI